MLQFLILHIEDVITEYYDACVIIDTDITIKATHRLHCILLWTGNKEITWCVPMIMGLAFPISHRSPSIESSLALLPSYWTLPYMPNFD